MLFIERYRYISMECRNSIFAMGEHQQGDGPASDGEYFIPVSKELSAGNYRICPGSAIPLLGDLP